MAIVRRRFLPVARWLMGPGARSGGRKVRIKIPSGGGDRPETEDRRPKTEDRSCWPIDGRLRARTVDGFIGASGRFIDRVVSTEKELMSRSAALNVDRTLELRFPVEIASGRRRSRCFSVYGANGTTPQTNTLLSQKGFHK